MAGSVPERADMPPAAIIGIGALLALSIAAAAIGRHTSHGAPQPAPPIASRLLRFADLPDGRVGVTDAATGGTVAILAREKDSFIRATVRDMTISRRLVGQRVGAPFQLTAWEDGRLTLTDVANGRALELEAFGPTNEGAFARLLTAEETQQ